MKNNYSKGELAKEILKGLALGGFIVACFVAPNFAQVAALFNAEDARKKGRLKQSLEGLRKKRLIRIYHDKNGKEIIEITRYGKKKMLCYQFDDLKISQPKKWDKLWRVVIFDVPEKHKKARDAISFKLKKIGFYPLQKSVFVCPYECKDEVDFVGEFFDVRRYINYFVVKEIEGKKFLKKKFNL